MGPKPECISALIERQRVRFARSSGSKSAAGLITSLRTRQARHRRAVQELIDVCSLIKHTALLTVEGERDDICGLGQTLAAQDLCTELRQYMKMHHVQTGVGHYGVFSGRRWNNEVYPMVRDIIQMTN
jgi:polyhydroxyalkanoate depolymerase